MRLLFTAKELADLTLGVAPINAWNRLSIAARTEPGTYQACVEQDLEPIVMGPELSSIVIFESGVDFYFFVYRR